MPTDVLTPRRPANSAPTPSFAVWSDGGPKPGKLGMARYPDVLLEIFVHLPNLELFRERRLHEPGPVPVRFQV